MPLLYPIFVLCGSEILHKSLMKQLKENPSVDNIANMLRFYKEKLLTLEENAQNNKNRNIQSK